MNVCQQLLFHGVQDDDMFDANAVSTNQQRAALSVVHCTDFLVNDSKIPFWSM